MRDSVNDSTCSSIVGCCKWVSESRVGISEVYGVRKCVDTNKTLYNHLYDVSWIIHWTSLIEVGGISVPRIGVPVSIIDVLILGLNIAV